MRDILSLDGYERLACAVVMYAAEDYRLISKVLNGVVTDGDRRLLEGEKRSIEKFFRSDYGDILCFGKGKVILEGLMKE